MATIKIYLKNGRCITTDLKITRKMVNVTTGELSTFTWKRLSDNGILYVNPAEIVAIVQLKGDDVDG